MCICWFYLPVESSKCMVMDYAELKKKKVRIAARMAKVLVLRFTKVLPQLVLLQTSNLNICISLINYKMFCV